MGSLFREVLSLKKWWIVFVASAVAIGCGGGGGAGTGGTTGGITTGGPPPVTAPTVALVNDGKVQIVFVSGAGRRGFGENYISITSPQVRNGPFDVAASSFIVQFNLAGFTLVTSDVTVPIPLGQGSKTFSEYPLEINGFFREASDGSLTKLFDGVWLDHVFALDMRVYRGRTSVLQLNLNDLTFVENTVMNPPFEFDLDLFMDENLDFSNPLSPRLTSFFGDYVAFDLTAMSGLDRPKMTGGADVDKFLVSGDEFIGLGAGFGGAGSLEMLTPLSSASGANEIGVLGLPEQIADGSFLPGTYTIFEPDIQNPNPGANTVLSLQGIWRPYTEVLSNIGQSAMVVFPNSRNDVSGFTAVYLRRDADGNIIDLWQGPARLFDDGISIDEIRLTPVRDIVTGLEIDPAVGVLGNFNKANGEIVSGTFTFSPALAPAAFQLTSTGDVRFQLTGEFVVFRR
ncbi:MAG: hypothetical protein IIC73_02200 [Armatimonadetes bacterium]|nr:hypothetical protein [Armatimonadota bacterium]